MTSFTNSNRILTVLSTLCLALFLCCSSEYKANMFNKTASDPDSKPEKIISDLNIKPGHTVADLGAGGGYFTFKFVKKVGKEGRIYAVDVNKDFLQFLRDRIRKEGQKNITTVLAKKNDTLLPKKSIDLVFVRNVFHHLPDQENYFKKLQGVLKPGGRIAIVEHNDVGIFMKIHGHHTQPKIIKTKMGKAGYRVIKEYTYLPKQSFIIFMIGK